MSKIPITKILNDRAKWIMIMPKCILESVNLWPEQKNIFTNVTFFLMILICILMEIAQFVYFLFHIQDIPALTKIMSTLSVTFQAITKMVTIFINADELNSMIKKIWNEFWPSDLLGKSANLPRVPKLLYANLFFVYISGMTFGVGFLLFPFIKGNFELPYEAWYPFDHRKSPYYELTYVVQFFMNIHIVMNTICGHDYLFVAMCNNCVAQFELLKEVFGKIGTGTEKELNDKLCKISGVFCGNGELEEKKLLVICVAHHQKLITICRQLKRIFSFTLFVQLAMSVMSLCVSSFLIMLADVDRNQQTHLIIYCIGHVSQLFVFCAVSNELTDQSISLSDAVFGSGWYLDKFIDIKKCIPLIIQRSQMGNFMTAMNMFVMNYATFILVLRFSFSMYTFLGRMAE